MQKSLQWVDLKNEENERVISAQIYFEIKIPTNELKEEEKERIQIENNYLFFFLHYKNYLESLNLNNSSINKPPEPLYKINAFGYPQFNVIFILFYFIIYFYLFLFIFYFYLFIFIFYFVFIFYFCFYFLFFFQD